VISEVFSSKISSFRFSIVIYFVAAKGEVSQNAFIEN
jgi:hypothetical protein